MSALPWTIAAQNKEFLVKQMMDDWCLTGRNLIHMPLTEDDVCAIATYARIGLDDEQIAAMTVDLNNIVESLAPITEMNLEGVEPTFHPLAGLVNVMREDEFRPGLSTAAALSNTDYVEDNAFVVPPILSGGDE